MNWLNEMLQSDPDPLETREWIDSMQAVIEKNGALRAHQLLEGMVEVTRRAGAYLPFSPTTEYVNTIASQNEAKSPGDAAMEWRIRSIIRWNAMAMVVRANRKPGDLGGHIASFASIAASPSTTSASTISGARPATSIRATCCSSRATVRRASTRAPSWKVASTRRSWTTSAWKSMARAFPRTRIPG